MTHEKKCRCYEKRKNKINETKLPHLWNHHKISSCSGFCGTVSALSLSEWSGSRCWHWRVSDSSMCSQSDSTIYSTSLHNTIYPFSTRYNSNFNNYHLLNLTIMAKQYLLFAKKEIDTNKQSVSVNQVVQMEGYNYPKYVV